DWDCLRAAVANGADAVYFGLPRFNARLRAENFQAEELGEVMAYLHRYGRKGFVTFNTLIFPAELDAAAEQLRLLERNSVDAIIVQDVGLVLLARRIAPQLEVHASTQMTITSPEGLAFAGALGIRRAVLARELSLRELSRFQDGPVPIEVFVHGALCVAYSGQCLTSESLGQRSANRGECAQACRMPYQLVVDGEIQDMGDRRFLLSPQDLAGVREIPDLIRLGVTCFKIEGRLKSPEYVSAVTKIYRNAIDAAVKAIEQETAEPELAPADQYALEMTFSRGFYSGWLHGVNHQRLVEGSFGKKRGAFIGRVTRLWHDAAELDSVDLLKPGDGVVFENLANTDQEEGGRIFEIRNQQLRFANGKLNFERIRIGSRVWKTSDPSLERALRRTFEHDPAIPIDISVRVIPGEAMRARFIAGGAITEARSSIPVAEAKSIPLTKESLKTNFGRLGETGFELQEFNATITGPGFLPRSVINEVRRHGIATLQAKLKGTFESVSVGRAACPTKPWRSRKPVGEAGAGSSLDVSQDRVPRPPAQLSVLARTAEQVGTAVEAGIAQIYVDLEDVRRSADIVRKFGAEAQIFLATPRIQKPGEHGFFRLIANARPAGVLVRNLGAIHFFRDQDFVLQGDFSLNVANPITAQYFLEQGLSRLTISYDLNHEQVLELLQFEPTGCYELVIHQHMPMFHMEHCVFAAFLSTGTDHTNCGRPCDRHAVQLQDRVGARHALKADVGCRNTLFNSRAQTGAEFYKALRESGLNYYRVELLNEDRQRTLK
ncbi:MAG: U32 family peptidase, partial [Verrucomicrobia bacterium]|nr:U32 family peptidase [Verrucomicrobiota bacterium]